jgi:hypothetical protein
VHTGDPIPGDPATKTGYRHIKPEYKIYSGNDQRPYPKDIIQHDSDQDPEGWLFTNLLDAAAAHLFYFNKITECSGDSWAIPYKR